VPASIPPEATRAGLDARTALDRERVAQVIGELVGATQDAVEIA